jgi:pilus assembly protein Flp/PilA
MLRLWTAYQSRFIREEKGATMVEYGLMVALIAVVVIVAVTAIGTNLNTKFGQVATDVAGAGS